ncbi:NYN domain-containing protein [Bacillus velezensis]|uniref:NYN domain-containing protein n=1 Tax=Bacillus velezensis TaxID=492670 RepID=UPI003C260C5A
MDEAKGKRTGTVAKPLPQPAVDEQLKSVFQIMTSVLNDSNRTYNSERKLDNVAIFVDYDNVYWSLMNNYSHDPDHESEEKNLFSRLWERYGQDNVRSFRVYADFQKLKSNMTSLQKKRVQIRHVYSNGKDGDHRKNASDIELCIDAIENTYKDPSISCYVFVTADSDMIPIMSRLMYKGKRVELFYLSKTAPKHIEFKEYVHFAEDLVKLLGIEEKQYDRNKLSIQLLKWIKNWHVENERKEYKFLGGPALRRDAMKDLAAPGQIISELIEQLKQEGLILEKAKKLTQGTLAGQARNEFICSEAGLKKIDESSQEQAKA